MNTIAPVILSPYNAKWIDVFSKEKIKLSDALGENMLIEHIGSTAIPDATAKPEIDIMIGVEKLEDSKKYIPLLEKLGYVYFPKFEEFVSERRYLRKSDGIIPLFHIHMVEQESVFWKDHIIFREYLKNNPDYIIKYNVLKKDLLLKYGGDRKSYSKGKEEFIIDVLKIAKQ